MSLIKIIAERVSVLPLIDTRRKQCAEIGHSGISRLLLSAKFGERQLSVAVRHLRR
jgi:hypothetical protein